MPELIENPTRVEAAGTKPKLIDEYVGRVNTGEERVSVARMRSPQGWEEPGQRPDFDEWMQYSTPYPGGAEYVAVCLPAFSPDTVHRDDDGA